jgi:hypothetical protein
MKLTVIRNEMERSFDTFSVLNFNTEEEIEAFIHQNSFDKKGNLILCEGFCDLKISDFPKGNVQKLIIELNKVAFHGDGALFSYKLY